jgi:hypothetical protein
MRATAALTLTASLVLGTAVAASADPLTATPASVAGATMTATMPTSSAPVGVSPGAFFDGTTYYLWTSGRQGRTYTSGDGRTWVEAAGARLPENGVDWSVVQEGPGSYRMYFAEFTGQPSQGPMGKRLRYATSTDLLTWTVQPGVLIEEIGGGVPHVMKTSDGRYFAYYNLLEPRGVHVATSPDGVTWTQLDVVLANDPEVVDPSSIQLPDGTFLMLAAKHGGPGGYTALRILTSRDAITWRERVRPLRTLPGGDAIDPVLVLVNGQLRVWFAYARGGDIEASRITDGILTLAPATPKAGARCTKRGTTSGKLVCAKRDGLLVWVRR